MQKRLKIVLFQEKLVILQCKYGILMEKFGRCQNCLRKALNGEQIISAHNMKHRIYHGNLVRNKS